MTTCHHDERAAEIGKSMLRMAEELSTEEQDADRRAFLVLLVAWPGLNALYNAYASLCSKRRVSEEVRLASYIEYLQSRAALEGQAQVSLHQRLAAPPLDGSTRILQERGKIETLKGTHEIRVRLDDGVLDAKSILGTCYQIRCNLFHGGKQCEDVEDVKLVEAAGLITLVTLHHGLRVGLH